MKAKFQKENVRGPCLEVYYNLGGDGVLTYFNLRGKGMT